MYFGRLIKNQEHALGNSPRDTEGTDYLTVTELEIYERQENEDEAQKKAFSFTKNVIRTASKHKFPLLTYFRYLRTKEQDSSPILEENPNLVYLFENAESSSNSRGPWEIQEPNVIGLKAPTIFIPDEVLEPLMKYRIEERFKPGEQINL